MRRSSFGDALGAPSASAPASGTAAFTKSSSAFKSAFAEVSAGALAKFMMALDPSGKKAEPLKNALKPVLDSLTRNTLQLAEDLSEADIEAHRKALKAADMAHKMKMEASRTANAMQMQNQAAEMEGSFNRALAAKVEQLQMGGSSALREAQEKNQELQEELHKATKDLDRATEQNKSLRSLLSSKEAEAKMQESEAERLAEQVQEIERRSMLANKDTELENRQLRDQLKEAAAEVERARSRAIADTEIEMEGERARMREQIAAAKRETAEARRQLDEMWADSGGGPEGSSGPDMRGAFQEQKAQLKRLTEQLESARQQMVESERESSSNKSEVDSLRREMQEKMTRILAEAQRATLQSADECKRQVEAMAARIRAELDKAKRHEREHAQDQLSRLLGEITVLNKQLGTTEAKLREAQEQGASTESLVNRIKKMEAQERAARDALSQALGDVQTKASSNLQLNEQLSRLINFYRQVKGEAAIMKLALDKALRNAGALPTESMPLLDKLNQLVEIYKQQQDDATAVRDTLDKALADVSVVVGENANLSDKLRQLLVEYRRMSENDLSLRAALKRQNASLNAAYHRVKDVEVELTRSQAAGVEQRDVLVNAALIALQQLRGRLGNVNALHKETATKPVEEALIVRRMQQSASVPSFGGDAPLQVMRPPTGVKGSGRFDAFMERIADAVGVPADTPHGAFPPVSPYWSVASSRPVPDGPMGGRHRELSPVAMPRVPRPGTRSLAHEFAGLSRSDLAATPGSSHKATRSTLAASSSERLSLLYGGGQSPQ